MEERILSGTQIQAFSDYLIYEEKSDATRDKYLRDVRRFFVFADKRVIKKDLVMEWKKRLTAKGYAVSSINSMLASLNSLLSYLGWEDCKVRNFRIQRQTYSAEEKELTKCDYLKLLDTAKKDEQLYLILQTICATGIRVSELKYFTVEALQQGKITVDCKCKTRTILIPGKLRKRLLAYAKRRHLLTGEIFLGKNKKSLHRSSIWRKMKLLCKDAMVDASKVFPHNLRKLFARTFYRFEKDIAKLADILGHSSINTTRIYIMTTGTEHRRKIERLGLVI